MAASRGVFGSPIPLFLKDVSVDRAAKKPLFPRKRGLGVRF
jgi:hypothetical protein